MKSLVILALALAASSPALGKDKEKRKNDKPAPAPAAESPASGPNSESLRKGKKFLAALELLGVQTQMGIGSGLRGGMYLNSDSLVEIHFSSAEAKFDSDSFSDSDYSAGIYEAQRTGKASLFEVMYKHFATNSFYWSAGVGDRQSEAHLEAYRFLSDDRETVATAKTHDIGLSAAIGNQWQWGTFMMGCDWIGFYIPVLHLSQDKQEDNTPTEVSDAKSIDKARDEFYQDETEGNAQGVRFYLGASF